MFHFMFVHYTFVSRIEPGSPDPESDALTIRPVRPPIILLVQFGLLRGHLLGNSCPLDKQFVLIVFCLFVK